MIHPTESPGDQDKGKPVSYSAQYGGWLLFTSTISEEEKKKRVETFEKLKTKAGKKIIGVSEEVIFDPKVADALKFYDLNGDGVLDDDEIARVIQESNQRREQVIFMKKIVGVVIFALLLLLIVNACLTGWVIQLTKDTSVSDTNALIGKNKGMVSTEKPRYYTTILDIANLPPTALNSLNRLSFTTDDGKVHNYEVQGVEMDTTTAGTVNVFFTSDKQLKISSGQAILRSEDQFAGTFTETNLVVNADSPVTSTSLARRRMQLIKDYVDEGKDYHDLIERCSFTEGVCYHTFDEILALHEPEDAVGGRRLQDTSTGGVTYAEITADTSILTKNSKSGLSRAKDFLEKVFGQSKTDGKNGTVSVKFMMKESCIAYSTLQDDCKAHPAPSSDAEVDNIFFVAPFAGMQAERNTWWFMDEIEYNKDPYTIQIKVRYAHDQKRSGRRHVVMIDRQNPTHVVIYDEVTTSTNPSDAGFTLESPQTYLTNFKEEKAIADASSGIGALAGDNVRRLEGWDDAEYILHSHLQQKLPGFPRMLIADELLEQPTYGETHEDVLRRKLQDDSNIIVMETETTSNGAYGVVPASAVNDSSLPDAYKVLPVASDMRKNVSDIAMPLSLFSEPTISNIPQLIQWPTAKSIVQIPEFNNIEIPHRSQLKVMQERNSNYSATVTERSRRLAEEVLAETEKDFQRILAEVDRLEATRAARHADYNEKMDSLIGYLKSTANELAIDREAHQRRLSTNQKCSAQTGSDLRSKYDRRKNNILNSEDVRKMKTYVNYQLPSTSDGSFVMGLKPNTNCSLFNSDAVRVLLQISTMNDDLTVVNDITQSMIKFIDRLDAAERKLETLINIERGMKAVVPVAGKIPYVGIALKAFYNTFSNLVKATVSPAESRLQTINQKIRDKRVKDKLVRFSDFTCKFLFRIESFSQRYIDVVNAVIVADLICPNTKIPDRICYELDRLLTPIVLELNFFKGLLDDLIGKFTIMINFITRIMSFDVNFNIGFLDVLADILKKISDFLNRTISVTLRIRPCLDSRVVCANIPYPCGIRWCRKWFVRYPCGVNICHYYTCARIYFPSFCDWTFSFSIMDILNAVLGVLEVVMNALMGLLESLARAIGINFPTINLPGLPSFDLFDMFNNLLDLFDFGFFLPNFNLNDLFLNDIIAFFGRLDALLPTLPRC